MLWVGYAVAGVFKNGSGRADGQSQRGSATFWRSPLEGGSTSKGCMQPLEAEKGRETDPCWGPQKERRPADTRVLAGQGPFWF